jgi:hypothetical protein
VGKPKKLPVASRKKLSARRKPAKASSAPSDLEALIRKVGERAMRRLEDEVQSLRQDAGKRSSGKRK